MIICRKGENREVIYHKKRFEILNTLRNEAIKIIECLDHSGIKGYAHGSVARGDVSNQSDVDIVILNYLSPPLIENSIYIGGFKIYKTVIIQATPQSTPKVYYYLDHRDKTVVSYPLSKLKEKELYFYKFSGIIDLNGLKKGLRVKGVDKRLMLIHPLDYGHYEECILDRSGYVAKILDIPESIVNERIYMLGKREIYGRTGVFLEYTLHPGEDVLEAVRTIASKNRFFRESIYYGWI
ncbi:TPA: DNA polymerase subunit beta [Candidatus Geothermarchaeota archaeon]|nr:DNA polymerase subunit beta [Candidatus Geothermarchaeota archaeon]